MNGIHVVSNEVMKKTKEEIVKKYGVIIKELVDDNAKEEYQKLSDEIIAEVKKLSD